MGACCCVAAGCAVGIGVYAIIAGAAAGVTTIVVIALNALSKIPAFSKHEKMMASVQVIKESCLHFRQKAWHSLLLFFEKIQTLFGSLVPTAQASSCCHGNKGLS